MRTALKTLKTWVVVPGVMLLAFMAGMAHGETNYWTGAGDGLSWEDTANWSLGQPVATQDVATTNATYKLLLAGETPVLGSFTMGGGTLTMTNWATSLRADYVTINKGLLTVPPVFTESQMSNRIHIVCTDFQLANGAMIDVNGKGYAGGSGHGKPPLHAYGGAGYGGVGNPGREAWGNAGQEYGDPLAPTDPGSGGAVGVDGGAGGGAVWIDATGDVILYGAVQANGGTGASNRGGGSGGSIRIDCERLFGRPTAKLEAKGGNGINLGGAGGGGRIAIRYNPVSQGSLDSPNPGIKFSIGRGSASDIAQAGTLYLPDFQTLFLSETLTTQWDKLRVYAPESTVWEPASLSVAGKITFPDLRQIRIPGNLSISNGVELTLVAGNQELAVPVVGMLLEVGENMTVAGGGKLVLQADHETGLAPFIECKNLDVAATGVITANYRGFNPEKGIEPGYQRGGGGYGGAGGGDGGTSGSYNNGGTYGRAHAPVFCGSGGGNLLDAGGRGGAAIRIAARVTMHVAGTLSANGMDALKGHDGGGAGGTVLLTCNSFSGMNATITANGGAGITFGSGGGGGRIAILMPYIPRNLLAELAEGPRPGRLEALHAEDWDTFNGTLAANWAEFSGTITARGGAGRGGAGYYSSEPGTFFYGILRKGTQLIIR